MRTVIALCVFLLISGINGQTPQKPSGPAGKASAEQKPPKSSSTLEATLASVPYLSTFASALKMSGETPTSGTILVPTNAAFSHVAEEYNLTSIKDLWKNKELVAKIVKYHILPSTALQTSSIKDTVGIRTALSDARPVLARSIKTNKGETLYIFRDGVKSAVVMYPNIKAGNIVVHVISKVLTPTPPKTAAAGTAPATKSPATPAAATAGTQASKPAANQPVKATTPPAAKPAPNQATKTVKSPPAKPAAAPAPKR